MTRLWQRARTELFTRRGARFPALDGIRAVAVLLIVLFLHCANSVARTGPYTLEPAPAGLLRGLLVDCWIGVDVFFVLSGFLIGRILFEDLAQGGIHFKVFYVRRVFRIFPAYYLVLTLSLLIGAHLVMFRSLYGGATGAELLRRSPANYLYISNYLYGSLVSNVFPLSWSLCIEEHFYLVFPAVLALLFRYCRPPLRVAVLVGLAFVPLALRSIAYAGDPSLATFVRVYPLTHTRADGLFMGALVAYGFVYHHAGFARVVRRLGSASWAVGIGCIALVFSWSRITVSPFPVAVLDFFLVAAGTSLVLTYCVFVERGLASVLAWSIWYPFARVSYGIYLVHIFVLMWLHAVWPGGLRALANSNVQFSLFAGGGIILSFLVAAAMFLGLEQRMLKRGAQLSRRYQQRDAEEGGGATHRRQGARA